MPASTRFLRIAQWTAFFAGLLASTACSGLA
jgi:hypothetical protein